MGSTKDFGQEVAKGGPLVMPVKAPVMPYRDSDKAIQSCLRLQVVGDPNGQRNPGPRQGAIKVNAVFELAVRRLAEGKPLVLFIDSADPTFPRR
jgi:hypothetical protein